uniref:C-X-C chemokine receptor type 3-like n=1 Tax=Euleptes europaea TaxID=460621 RepID=UPI0025404333|nr:C-X-C chemokine receptor type 3-like [Euleptes europaea]
MADRQDDNYIATADLDPSLLKAMPHPSEVIQPSTSQQIGSKAKTKRKHGAGDNSGKRKKVVLTSTRRAKRLVETARGGKIAAAGGTRSSAAMSAPYSTSFRVQGQEHGSSPLPSGAQAWDAEHTELPLAPGAHSLQLTRERAQEAGGSPLPHAGSSLGGSPLNQGQQAAAETSSTGRILPPLQDEGLAFLKAELSSLIKDAFTEGLRADHDDYKQSLDSDTLISYYYGNGSTSSYFSYNESDYNESEVCCLVPPCDFYTIQAFERVFLPCFYTLIFLLGLCGNIMVMAVSLRTKESLPGTDVFIFNLAIADVLLVATLPFWAAQAVHSWIFGEFLCKVVGSIFKINFYSSIFFLVCISFDRYLSIVYVIRMYKRSKSSWILISSLAIWVFCILLAVPDFIFLKVEFDSRQNTNSCSLNFSSSWKITLHILNQVVAFFLPLLTMAYCYTHIIFTLLSSKGFPKQKALRVILVVVAVFFLCWTPYHLVKLIETLIYFKVLEQSCEWKSKMEIAETITTSLGFSHCCLNPLLYAFVGIKFRNRFIELLEQVGCVSRKFLKRHAHLSSHRKDSTWSESTEPSYAGL